MRSKQAGIWRHLQLLLQILNELQQCSFIPLLMVISTVSTALAMAVLVKSNDILTICLTVVMLPNTVSCLITILSAMASIYTKSKHVLEGKKRNQKLQISGISGTWELKFYKSCRPLRIIFGLDNFIDELTPLHCLEESTILCVNLLLLT